MNVGLLTGGGDCPGLNAALRAVVRRISIAGGHCVGIIEGWRGLVRNLTTPLSVEVTDDIVGLGGTILGSSRTNPYKNPETDLIALRKNFGALGLDALVVIGGDDTLGVAVRLYNDFQMPVGAPGRGGRAANFTVRNCYNLPRRAHQLASAYGFFS
jgi:ATP-dependent phosphofructokinase / diphosphate-dependent phosphofructokinase